MDLFCHINHHLCGLNVAGVQWSFGVLMWELLTRGAKPYEGIEPMRMRRYLKDGNRLAKPSPATPDFAYAHNFHFLSVLQFNSYLLLWQYLSVVFVHRCGVCPSVCPIKHTIKKETQGPISSQATQSDSPGGSINDASVQPIKYSSSFVCKVTRYSSSQHAPPLQEFTRQLG